MTVEAQTLADEDESSIKVIYMRMGQIALERALDCDIKISAMYEATSTMGMTHIPLFKTLL
jgi:hypothetical protein